MEYYGIYSRGVFFFKKKQPDINSIEWNEKTNEVIVDFEKIKQMCKFLKHLYLSEMRFENQNVLFVLNIRH